TRAMRGPARSRRVAGRRPSRSYDHRQLGLHPAKQRRAAREREHPRGDDVQHRRGRRPRAAVDHVAERGDERGDRIQPLERGPRSAIVTRATTPRTTANVTAWTATTAAGIVSRGKRALRISAPWSSSAGAALSSACEKNVHTTRPTIRKSG